jgi:hypothetical protein
LPFFCLMPGRRSSRALRPPLSPERRVVKTMPLNVGEGGGRHAVLRAGGAEGCQHVGAGDPDMSGDEQGVAGVVVEPGEDLGIGPASERVVGEVGLPALVRQLGGEPDAGRLRAFRGIWGDQAVASQVAADGRRGDLRLVMLLQVPGDGLRPGVQSLPGQFLAQPGDQFDGSRADRRRGGLRPPGPRLERRLALGLLAVNQGVDPGPGDPVSPGRLRDRALFDNDGSNDKPGLRHPGSVQPAPSQPREARRNCPRCLETPVLHVLKLDTTPATTLATTCENGPGAAHPRLCGPFFSVPPCVTLSRCRALCYGGHGHIADGVRVVGAVR